MQTAGVWVWLGLYVCVCAFTCRLEILYNSSFFYLFYSSNKRNDIVKIFMIFDNKSPVLSIKSCPFNKWSSFIEEPVAMWITWLQFNEFIQLVTFHFNTFNKFLLHIRFEYIFIAPFLIGVVRLILQEAGQICTAIRRYERTLKI